MINFTLYKLILRRRTYVSTSLIEINDFSKHYGRFGHVKFGGIVNTEIPSVIFLV